MLLHSDLINTQIVHMHLTEKFGMLPATRNFGIVRIPEMLDALSTKDKNEVHCSNPCRIPLLQIPPPDSPPPPPPPPRAKAPPPPTPPPPGSPCFPGDTCPLAVSPVFESVRQWMLPSFLPPPETPLRPPNPWHPADFVSDGGLPSPACVLGCVGEPFQWLCCRCCSSGNRLL